ncbi:MAG: ABC transporter ATP-binding protein [Tissierellia bacterium]|nr:ABC transporter ATP-binding protein [Tissierellia bacterium]
MKKKKIHETFVTKKLIDYSLQEKRSLTIGLVLTFIRTWMEIVGPLIVGYILNHYIKADMVRRDFLQIGKLLAIYLVVYLLCGLFSNLAQISFEEAANKITFAVQKDVYHHVQSFPISYFDSLPAGNIVSRITNDTQRLKRMFQLILSEMITAGIMVVGIYLMILYTNFWVAILILVLVPILYIMFVDLRYKTSKYTTLNRRYVAEVNSDLNENIQNMEIIQAFNREGLIKEEFDDLNRRIFSTNLELTKLRSYSGFRGVDGLQYVAVVIVLVYFGIGQITKSYPVSIGSMYIVIDYVTKIFTNLKRMFSRFGDLEQSYASAAHIFDLFKMPTQEKLPEVMGEMVGEVSFEQVTFAYDREDVLKNIDFHVNPGESVAFVGSTGSGKSTIINLLLNFYSPQKGRILVDGRDIKNINRRTLREEMAVVLQDAFLFETTVKDNIKLDDPSFRDEEIEKALLAVGGDQLVERGIDEKILEKGNNLSQGEKQLISFARAYIRNPKILILDEATSNIDTETEKMIQRGIEKLKEDRTTFIIAHRLSTIKDVDKIFVLNKGRIIEEGNHEQLMALNGFYRNMYDEQMENS